jgi:hypothetical protein
MLLTGLLLQQQQRQFQFCALDPAVFLVFWCTQCSLNRPTDESLVVLGQEIGVVATHSSSQIVMNNGFTDTSFESALPHRLLGDRVMTGNTVNMSTVSWTARPSERSLSTFSLFNQLRTYHATVKLLHMLVMVFQTNLFNTFPPPVELNYPLALLKF